MSFKKKLLPHLVRWEEKKIITAGQKVAILEDMETESSGAGFLKILATIGVVCIWAWVLLIIAGNWSGFPKALQLVMALALPIISLILAYYFTYIQVELRKIGQAFSLLGWLMIWASIALIWQIYNTDGSVWWLLIMWMILVLPLIYVFKLKTLSVLATMLLYGALFYYTEDNRWWFWGKWDNMFALFTIISWLMSVWAYCLNQVLKEKYNYLLYPVAAISLKVLFFVLFMCTIDDWFSFLGDGIAWVILHNVLFLAVIFGTMWWANKNSEILLRHATFVWFGIWLAWKYFALVGSYMQWGMFFVMSWIVLIGIVYGFIKINKKLWN